jgi:CheY-like chemotaxis protein
MIACPICKRHILVVDDDALVCETVTLILKIDGHFVDCASSGAQALALFQPGKFDLVITDFFMPAMTGDKLAAAIKTQSPKQPVMMLTAYPEKLQRECPREAVDVFVGKPFEIETLRNAISKCVPVVASPSKI